MRFPGNITRDSGTLQGGFRHNGINSSIRPKKRRKKEGKREEKRRKKDNHGTPPLSLFSATLHCDGYLSNEVADDIIYCIKVKVEGYGRVGGVREGRQ